MSRKTHKSMMRMGEDGQRRRSPRISSAASLDKDNHHHHHQQQQLRTRTKRKFDDSLSFTTRVSKLAKQVWKGRDSPKHAGHSTDCVLEWRSAGRDSQMMVQENHKYDDGKASSLLMPDKHTLELVLDTLQRRDTYEIFAEPVDPDEVEDYYEIIEEPMDFGTMRAKLHEGMYENLQQFEHDVFLIPENAMYFNSSTTIYFRQARVVHELARKVFHALKTDPENFVSEFSGTRRRSMRKALSDPKEPAVVDVYSKGIINSNSPSTCRRQRAGKKNPDHATTLLVTGSRRDGRLSEEVADRRRLRQTYWSSLYNHQGNKSLLPMMNEGDYNIGYKDSLMSYVKDLGPTAQTVAKRKLLLLGQLQESDTSSATTHSLVGNPLILFRTFRDFAPAAAGNSNPFLLKAKASDVVIDLTQEEGRKRGEKKKTDDDDRAGGKEKISRNRPIIIAKKDDVTRNNNPYVPRPVILALETYHYSKNANAADQLRNKKSAADDQQQQRRRSISHQFIFDLPFLKERLHQMNKKNAVVPSLSFQKGRGGEGVNCTPACIFVRENN